MIFRLFNNKNKQNNKLYVVIIIKIGVVKNFKDFKKLSIK